MPVSQRSACIELAIAGCSSINSRHALLLARRHQLLWFHGRDGRVGGLSDNNLAAYRFISSKPAGPRDRRVPSLSSICYHSFPGVDRHLRGFSSRVDAACRARAIVLVLSCAPSWSLNILSPLQRIRLMRSVLFTPDGFENRLPDPISLCYPLQSWTRVCSVTGWLSNLVHEYCLRNYIECHRVHSFECNTLSNSQHFQIRTHLVLSWRLIACVPKRHMTYASRAEHRVAQSKNASRFETFNNSR